MATRTEATRTGAALLEALDPCSVLRRNGLVPDPWQAQELRAQPCFALWCWGRQIAKTTTAAALHVHGAVWRPGFLGLVTAYNQDRAKELLAKAATMLEPYEAEVGKPRVQTTERLELENGSRIIAIPAKPIAGRGPTADLVTFDEAAWTSRELRDSIFPTLMVRQGVLVAMSTPPEVQGGWWWEAWTKRGEFSGEDAVDGIRDMWRRSFVRSERSPRCTPEHMDKARETLTPDVIAREYLCEFPKDSADGTNPKPFSRDLLAKVFIEGVDDAPEARF